MTPSPSTDSLGSARGHLRLVGALTSILALLVLASGCGGATAGSEPAGSPGSPGCGFLAQAGVAPDPRIVGPGMRGNLLPHWPMFRHDGAHSGRSPLGPPASQLAQWSFAA